jgi:hypothetical protein
MPKATLATITQASSRRKALCAAVRSATGSFAWYL